MKCYVFVPEQMPFDGADLCIILGNLLDNAMEAKQAPSRGAEAHGSIRVTDKRKPQHHGAEPL